MTNESNSVDRMRSILVLVATIAMIAFNGLAAAGYVNGVTPEIISDQYPTVLTPAGYAFTIWSLIYLGLIVFSVFQLIPDKIRQFRTITSLYIASCTLNCLWIYFWHHNQIAICMAIIAALLGTLILILSRLQKTENLNSPWLTKIPFGIYAGWVTVATFVNFAVLLKYLNVEISAFGWNILGSILLLGAASVAAAVRFKFQNYVYPLAIAWAATAIAVKQSGNTSIVVASSVCVIVCLVLTVSFVMDQKSTTT